MTDIVIATLIIKDSTKMIDEKREEIARWLEKEANDLRKEGKNYSNHFRARFLKEA